MPSLCSTSDTQPAMLYHVEPQPCSSRQGLQEIEADPSRDYGFVSNLQVSCNGPHLDHPPILPLNCPLAAYERPQNSERNDDGNNFAEAVFGLEQSRSPSTLPFYPGTDLDWLQDAQLLHDLREKQMLCLLELGLHLEAADDESDTTASGPSSPSTPRDYYSPAAVSPPQTPYEASYNSLNLGQSTPGSFSDMNRGIQQSNR